jgi:hypothetical protein
LAKKKIIISNFETDKKKSSKHFNKGIAKKVTIAVLVIAVLVFAVIQIISASNSYIGTVAGKKIKVYEFQTQLSSVESDMTSGLSDQVKIEAQKS